MLKLVVLVHFPWYTFECPTVVSLRSNADTLYALLSILQVLEGNSKYEGDVFCPPVKGEVYTHAHAVVSRFTRKTIVKLKKDK